MNKIPCIHHFLWEVPYFHSVSREIKPHLWWNQLSAKIQKSTFNITVRNYWHCKGYLTHRHCFWGQFDEIIRSYVILTCLGVNIFFSEWSSTLLSILARLFPSFPSFELLDLKSCRFGVVEFISSWWIFSFSAFDNRLNSPRNSLKAADFPELWKHEELIMNSLNLHNGWLTCYTLLF